MTSYTLITSGGETEILGTEHLAAVVDHLQGRKTNTSVYLTATTGLIWIGVVLAGGEWLAAY